MTGTDIRPSLGNDTKCGDSWQFTLPDTPMPTPTR
jgi:hypothetical protein